MSGRPVVFGLIATAFVACAIPLVVSVNGKTPPIPWLFFASVVVAMVLLGQVVRLGPDRSAWKTPVAAFAVVAVGTAILFPVFASSQNVSIKNVCLSGAKHRARAILVYAADFDDRYPPAETWATVIDKYIVGERRHCPEAKTPFSYAYNASASHMRMDAVTDLDASVLLFESDALEPNAHGGREVFVRRHYERGTIAFMDGHVALKRDAPEDKLVWNPK